MSVYLICLAQPDPEVLESIREEWPDERYELSDTQILVVKSNGGKSIYERIVERLDGREFRSFVTRCQYYHGRHASDLWEWLGPRARQG